MVYCPKCKQEKNESEFNRDPKRKTWFRCYCRDCEKIRHKIYRATHLEQEKEYIRKNIDKVRANKRRYVEKHREEINAKRRADCKNQTRIKKNCAKKKPVRYRLMKIWTWILWRCNSPKDRGYCRYGARWIKCLWNSFEEFYNDMVDSYIEHWEKYWFNKKWTQLDRINNDWDYCKENCRRVTAKENNPANKKKRREITKLCFTLSKIANAV